MKLRVLDKDSMCVAALLAILLVRFFKTLVLGKSISELFLTAVWDSLFRHPEFNQSCRVDAALVQLCLPYRFFVAQYWHHAVPLWNKFSGFGMPLLADPQSFVLSPLFGLFYLLPNIHTWNLVLVMELAIGAISTYYLCREFELNHIGSFCSALLFTFCPWAQWNLELLGNGTCLTPFVFLFFLRMAKRKSLWSAITAGLAAAIDLLCAHPEMSFMTIIFATLLMVAVEYSVDRSNFNLLLALRRLGLAGLVAFGVCAPLLIPFGEFLTHCESYKLRGPALLPITWEALVGNYLYPFYPVSCPFFGPLSWWGVLAALNLPNKANSFVRIALIFLAISILSIIRWFPFNILFQMPLFSMVMPYYCLPEYLLLMSVISGFGITHVTTDSPTRLLKRLQITASVICLMLLVPLFYLPWHHDNPSLCFDPNIVSCHFNWRLWLVNISCVLLMLLTLIATVHKSAKSRTLGSCLFVAIGVINLMIVSSSSLPTRPSFEYPTVLPIRIDSKNESRFLSLGNHLFRPNINLIYGLPTVRMQNAVFPKGFARFIRASGASITEPDQIFPAAISPLLDLTGTQIILSEQPLLDDSSIDNCSKQSRSAKVKYSDLLELEDIELYCDTRIGAVFCRLLAKPISIQTGDFHLCFEIKDGNGAHVSFIEPQAIYGSLGNQIVMCSGFLPSSIKHWTASLRIINDKDLHVISPTQIPFGHINQDGSWLVGTSEQPEMFTNIRNNRFTLVSRYGTSIAAYKNNTALGRYFFGKQVKWVKNQEEAIDFMRNHYDQLRSTVVLEQFQKQLFQNCIQSLQRQDTNNGNLNQLADVSFNTIGTVTEITSTSESEHFANLPFLKLQIRSPEAALIVVSDLYYPGWRAFLDGKDYQIFRADYLFRAVLVPPGEHYLSFVYEPIGFMIGISIFIMTVLLLIAFWFGTRRKDSRQPNPAKKYPAWQDQETGMIVH